MVRAGALLVTFLFVCVALAGCHEPEAGGPTTMTTWGLGLDVDGAPEPAPFSEHLEERTWWFEALDAWKAAVVAEPECQGRDAQASPSEVLVMRYVDTRSACTPGVDADPVQGESAEEVGMELNQSHDEARAALNRLAAAMPSTDGFSNLTTIQMMAHIMGTPISLEQQLVAADTTREDYRQGGGLHAAKKALGEYGHIAAAANRHALLLEAHEWGGSCSADAAQVARAARAAFAQLDATDRGPLTAALQDYHDGFQTPGFDFPDVDAETALQESIQRLEQEMERGIALGLWPHVIDTTATMHELLQLNQQAEQPPWPTYEEARLLIEQRLHEERSTDTEWRAMSARPSDAERDNWQAMRLPALRAMAFYMSEWPYAGVTCADP